MGAGLEVSTSWEAAGIGTGYCEVVLEGTGMEDMEYSSFLLCFSRKFSHVGYPI